MIDDAYTDWQVHFETCAKCRRDWTCPEGVEAMKRDARKERR